MASSGQDRRVVAMLPLVVGIARLGFEHAWPVFIGRRHDVMMMLMLMMVREETESTRPTYATYPYI